MEIGAIAGALQSLKIATDFANYFRTADLSLEKADQKMKIAELISALADLKMSLASVQEEMLEKDKRITALKEQATLKGKVVYEKPYYFVVESGKKDGPYCQGCYDDKSKLIRLQEISKGYWTCSICNKAVEDSSYVSPAGVYFSGSGDDDY